MRAIFLSIVAAPWTFLAPAACGHPPPPVATTVPSSVGSSSAPRRAIGPLVIGGWSTDVTSPKDAPVTPDGKRDFTFRIRLSGDVTAIVLTSSDPKGVPAPDTFDTFVGATPIPKSLGLAFDVGSKTWQVAITRGDGTLVNPEARLPIPTTFRDELVTLSCSEIWPIFREGRYFTVFVLRPDGAIDRLTALLIDPTPP